MAVDFYDVNFNQPGESSIPAISGFIIDDEAYSHLSEGDGYVDDEHIISKPSATNNISGAISMARKRITVGDTTLTVCPLQGGNGHNIYLNYTSAGPIEVIICDDSGALVEKLVLPYLENNNNLSLLGHFGVNDELDFVTVAYSVYDPETRTSKVFLNKYGFSSSIMNEMKPYVYLKYKYPYQVVIQKGLRGSNDFQISRFPASWFNNKMYGTGEGRSQKFNETVCRLDPDYPNVFDMSAVWWRDPPVSTVPAWWFDRAQAWLSLQMGLYMEQGGGTFGSDIFRKLPTGEFYNGVDLSVDNIAWRDTSPYSTTPYDIPFTGGKIRLCFSGLTRHVQLLDSDDNVIDDYEMPYPVSGGGSTNMCGQSTWLNTPGIASLYLAENNNHYYLIGLAWKMFPILDDNGNQITLSNSSYGTYQTCAAYQILHKFSNEANNILYHATEDEKIVPANPDELTADETSNQTSDSENVNEYGNEIPVPEYNSGEWEDDTSEGIRGSGEGQETGKNIEGKLDEQPGMPGNPTIPTAVSTGFMKLYNPTNAEVQQLCAELTGDSVLLDLKKYLGNNPLDFIVGLQVVPGSYEIGQNKYKIKYGSFSSNVPMYPITNEFTTIDYGTLDLKEIYGSWEDYNPHTKMSIYLPYIGIREIDTDRVNGTQLSLKYYVDATTGSILACLSSIRKDDKNPGAEILVGQWAGQALYTIPLTNTQHDASINAIIAVVSAAVSVGVGIATGGSSTAAQIGAKAAGGVAFGNAALSAAKSQKTDITMQGAVSGNLAFFTALDAYIQIEFPIQGRPESYDHIVGKPSNITSDIAHQPLDNYIEFVNVDVSGIDAPPDEKQMIIDLLAGGIYT